MFATNPCGNTGLICDKCCVIIVHELDNDDIKMLDNGAHFCVSCYEELEGVQDES